ncbi:transport permease protein [Sphaerisporangium siamense]|uniref:Transport permease protein n=1 Tax=Sphaerisporangium siamense TaxID=795645 RepID=A0A7W7D8G9_9ACTN|nr:ABC transporter permease [Sphaerisporangium siamense]MBB4700866.1 lipooligosaccharide transport system permease protein [Sphaerisporangium siamense]GII85989.1 transport permease protein [Sphaerisporangium siamense]
MSADARVRPDSPAVAGTPRLFEWAPVRGVWRRELALYRRYWASTSFASLVEPTIYLLAFGFGFGSVIGAAYGYDYRDFVSTGVVATSVLFISAFGAMFGTFIRRTYQHTYDAVLAAPVDVHELVTAEASWLAAKAGVYGCAPVLVGVAFGLRPSPGMLLVPFIAFLTGLGFGLFGIWVSSIVPSINTFDYVISGVLAPMFLVAGTFFPVDQLPSWAAAVARVNPLYHCVELVRDAVFGRLGLDDLAHAGVLLLFAALMWGLAVWKMRARLID